MDWIKIVLFAVIILQELQIIILNKKTMNLAKNAVVLNQMMALLIDQNPDSKVIIEDNRTNKTDN